MSAVEPKPRVQSAARALSILSAVAASDYGLTPREIAEVVGVNRATAYHLIHTLVSQGFLTSGPQRRLRVGFRIGTLVDGFERQVVPSDLTPAARSLAAATGETAYIAVRRAAELAAVSSIPGAHPVSVRRSPLGPIDHAHARASGKLLLAFAPAGVRDAYLGAHPLEPRTPHTIRSVAELDRELATIRERGYATEREEYLPGVACLSVSLGGNTLTALSLSAPLERFDANFDGYRDAILAAARSPLVWSPRDDTETSLSGAGAG